MENTKCTTCNEVIEMVLEDIKAVREKNDSEVMIKNVPARKCKCDTEFSFRVGLEMSHYKRNDEGNEKEVDYSVIAELVKGKSNMEIIDPQGNLKPMQ